ncbi:MAG: SDR family oxidoreductase [Gammaproteobacteria bacterium]|nr:SDR family oxidoreductase [Gammaproteobacteria bacterium]
MDMGIAGRKAIINGASAGMGKQAALALAREGVNLVISARGQARVEQVARDIASETGVEVIPVAADHSTDEGRAKILAACPAPDILVATCSPPPMSPDFREIDDAAWYSTLEISMLSPIRFIRAVIDGMTERRWGRIVNIATVAAKYPLELRVLSGAPRAALINYTGALARSVAQYNVTLNNVMPGMFHTAFTETQLNERAKNNGTTYEEEVRKFVEAFRIPAGRFGDSVDVGAVVCMFCSEYAGYMTGQSIVMDGGTNISTF